jgi:hypothetical protein
MFRSRVFAAALLLLAAFAGGAAAEGAANDWRVVTREKGVLVSTRVEPGHDHQTYRGEIALTASVLHVLAIVLDTPKTTQWVRGADKVEIVKKLDARSEIVLMTTDLPWPIRDRDMVMKRTIEVLNPGTAFRVRYSCAPTAKAEQHGALRVKDCDSHFTIKRLADGRTYVDYQAYLDPGGGLPHWSVRWLEKRVAVDTLTKLDRQVRRTEGQYTSTMAQWASAK